MGASSVAEFAAKECGGGNGIQTVTAHDVCAYSNHMSAFDYDRSAPRKATNLSINSDLLRIARELRINLSRELEMRLEELIAERRREQWLAENQQAIEAYNEHIERDGVFSDGLRNF
jgi:antitoxin CcdA